MTDDDAQQRPAQSLEGVQDSTFTDLSSRRAVPTLQINPKCIPRPVDTATVVAVLRIGAPLDDEHREFLLDALRSPAEKRNMQRGERDAAVCEAFKFFEGSDSRRAKQLDHELSRYLADSWPREQNLRELPSTASQKRRALHRIARLAGSRGLGWRQILSIYDCNSRE